MYRLFRAAMATTIAVLAFAIPPSAAQATTGSVTMKTPEAACRQNNLLVGVESTSTQTKQVRVELAERDTRRNYYTTIDPTVNRWAYASFDDVKGAYTVRLFVRAGGTYVQRQAIKGAHGCDVDLSWLRKGKYMTLRMANTGTAYADVISTRTKPAPWQEHVDFPAPGRTAYRTYFVGTHGYNLVAVVDGTSIRSRITGSR